MRRLLTFLFVFFMLNLSAQDVSVELSIEWEKELGFEFKELDTVKFTPAFLKITYRNLCDSAIYFPKIYVKEGILPFTWTGSLIDRCDDTVEESELFYSLYSGKSSLVCIIGNPDLSGQLFIVPDTIFPDKSHFQDGIADILKGIHEYIYDHTDAPRNHSFWKSGMRQYCHSESDIGSELMELTNSYDGFVFLEPGGNNKDIISLVAFQMIGGTFTFCLRRDEAADFVCIENRMDLNKPTPIKKLPSEMKGYQLYRGRFFKNEVTVYFPGIKLSASANEAKDK